MISTLTINTALDKLLFIEEFKKNNTNRIINTYEVLGGKGTHVSINLSQMGIESRAFGVVFGKVGEQIKYILKNYNNIDVQFLCYLNGNSRTNYAIIEKDNTCTLVAEKGKEIPHEICNELIDLIEKNTAIGDYLVLSGDASNTQIPHIYNRIMERLVARNIHIFLDTSSDNLAEGIKAKPFMVKPNVDELSHLMGSQIQTDEEILEAINWISAQGVNVVAVSQGRDGSIVKYGSDIYKVYPLDVKVVNTIGCGDAYLSGIVYGFAKKLPFTEILRLAAAISSATAESELTVGFDYERVMSLKDKVFLKKI